MIPGVVLVFLIIVDFHIYYSILLLPIALLFILAKLPYSIKKIYLYFSGKPALAINDHFLIDNINGQKYEWSDIFEISFSEKHKAIRIVVGDANTAKYANNESWFLSRWVTKFDLGITHGTFILATQFLDPHHTALENLQQFYHSKKKAANDTQKTTQYQ